MPGYKLIESRYLKPHRRRGIAPAPQVIGILDFLRELQEEPFPFPRFAKVQVIGLEEALFAARPEERDSALEIHRRLNQSAGELQGRLLEVQVVFDGEIVRGADLSVSYRGASLPLHLIFNHPQRDEDANGNPFYLVAFHLSSP